jgi:hypothetical protein
MMLPLVHGRGDDVMSRLERRRMHVWQRGPRWHDACCCYSCAFSLRHKPRDGRSTMVAAMQCVDVEERQQNARERLHLSVIITQERHPSTRRLWIFWLTSTNALGRVSLIMIIFRVTLARRTRKQKRRPRLASLRMVVLYYTSRTHKYDP